MGDKFSGTGGSATGTCVVLSTFICVTITYAKKSVNIICRIFP